MKSPAILLGLSVLATGPLAFGQQADSRALKPVASGSPTVGEAIAMRRPRLVEGGPLQPKVIQLEAADSSLMIPAAGSVQGSGGTYFHSDLALANHRGTDQTSCRRATTATCSSNSKRTAPGRACQRPVPDLIPRTQTLCPSEQPRAVSAPQRYAGLPGYKKAWLTAFLNSL